MELSCENCGTIVRPKAPLSKDGRFHGKCPLCKAVVVFDVKTPAPLKSSVSFTINGNSQTVDNPDPTMSLNTYLREILGLKGTKLSCGEGGCGACVVAVTMSDANGQTSTVPINSCLRLLAACDGLEITTVEGIGSVRKGLHKVQSELASHWGSQCGNCSPGMVMSMYSLLEQNPKPSPRQVEDALDGNICRCTGYRPILAAFRTFCDETGKEEVDQNEALTDLEDFSKVYHKPCTKLACATECCGSRSDKKCAKVMIKGPVNWIEPLDLPDLLNIIDTNKGNDYMLVSGNTSTGVYRDTNPSVKIDISHLATLKTTSVDPKTNALTVGAGVTLQSLILFLEANGSLSQSYVGLAQHLRIVASPPIRSAGSWAGNIMMVHAHPDFPSDVFTILLAVNATLTVASKQTTTTLDLLSFASFDMSGWVITSVTIPPLGPNQHYASHKIMKRHINSHAYVNAAVVVEVDGQNTVTTVPRMVFAGLSPSVFVSSKAALFLSGKTLDSVVLQVAAEMVVAEITPASPPASSSVAYRQSLVSTLLYKSLLAALPITEVSPRVQSACVPYQRAISSGQQSFKPDPSVFPLTQPLPKLSANQQTCGEAQYAADVKVSSNTFYGQFVLASQGNAVLQSLDVSAANAVDGVVDIILGADFPNVAFGQEPLLVATGSRVEYRGQAIALVLATSQAVANEAALLVTEKYTDAQKVYANLEDAIAAKNFFPSDGMPHTKIGKPIADALKECDTVVSGEFDVGSQYHFHLETQTALAVYNEEGYMDVYSATQSPTIMQQCVSEATGIPANKVNIIIRRVGGAYGGKITRSWFATTAAAIAANKHENAVKIVTDLHTNMRMIGKRCPYKCVYSVGTLKNKLHAVQMIYYQDCGSYNGDAVGGMEMAIDACDNAYFCPNWDVTGQWVKTNLPANTATRAPGCVDAIYFMESIMDHMASSLKIPKETLCFNNLYQKGQTSVTGMKLNYCSLTDLWNNFYETNAIANRQAAIEEFNRENMWRKRGLSVGANKYGLSYAGYNISVYVIVNSVDGSVTCSTGGCEIGQGLNVKLAQVVARELNVTMDKIDVRATSTDVHANSTVTGGSCTSDAASIAAMDACSKINAVLQPLRESLEGNSWEELISKAASEGLDLGARGWSNAPSPEGGFYYNSYGIVGNEVEIDILTGEIQILRTDILFDCGQSLNYAVDIGQVEGGFVMGLGLFLTEEIIFDETTGELYTDGTWEYKPPSNKDIPIDFRVTMLPDAPNPTGVLRSKASGEPPTCMASNVLFAIKQAILASLNDRGVSSDYLAVNAPFTPEKIQQACQVATDQFVM
eukprot:m.78729 g.78729  ORF g.78729 m.78729 type:complete len:1316 (+) comp8584_c1_seq1:41-3988(+)